MTENGSVAFLKPGTVKIKATSTKDTSKYGEVDINVKEPDPQSISIISENNVTEINIFDTIQFTAVVSPDLAFQSVTWSVSDESIATIDSKGKLTAKAVGTVIITATSTVLESVKGTFELKIVQPDPVQIIYEIGQKDLVYDLNETDKIKATIQPLIAVQDIVFASSDTNVVTVDENGNVKAVGEGSAKITIKSKVKESVKVELNIKVVDVKKIQYSKDTIILDAAINAKRFDKITYDGKEYYVNLNAFTSAKDAFNALVENSKLIVKSGKYDGATTIKANGVQIIGPNASVVNAQVLENRTFEEAVFTGIMTLDGVQDITISGIALSKAGQIRSEKPLKNITIQNIYSFDSTVPAGEGVIFFGLSNANQKNENILVQNSHFFDSNTKAYGQGFRGVRVNNAKDLYIKNNYFTGFYDSIRLEGEGNADRGKGFGVSGKLLITENVFVNNFQYPIWVGMFQAADVEIIDNFIGVCPEHYGVYGYIYLAGFKPTDTKTVVNILRNEFPYAVYDYHHIRFNTGGATADQLEINVNYNIFHEKPNIDKEKKPYKHIIDHLQDSKFTINGKNNYFLYEDDVIAEYFTNSEYEPYSRSITVSENESEVLVDFKYGNYPDGAYIYLDEKYYKLNESYVYNSLAKVQIQEGLKIVLTAGVYSDAVTIDKNNITIVGPNKDIKAKKGLADREKEAIIVALITLDGVENITIDGIALTGKGQIRSTKPVKNITIQNVYGYDHNIDPSQGVINFVVSSANDKNENILIQDSVFIDSLVKKVHYGYRCIRINNAKDLYIKNNYFVGFYDTIRLEGENSSAMGSGFGVSGKLLIENNEFEYNYQYPIWVGRYQDANVEITNNYIGVYPGHTGVYGYIYLGGFKPTDTKTVVNILRNEFPYTVAEWYHVRFNTGGATASQLEINVNYNIFHEAPTTEKKEGQLSHVVDHFENSRFVINAKHNYYLYEGDVKPEYFKNAEYEPYYRTLDQNDSENNDNE